MPEVLFNNDDVTVLGPPSTIELALNIGPQGVRGNKIFVGSGDPNTLTTSGTIFAQELELNDLYINASPGPNYGYMWQYIAGISSNIWVEVLRLNPVIYSENYLVDFTATGNIGEGSVVIPIENIAIVSGTPLTAENFNVQYAVVNSDGYPIASSMIVPALVTNDLVINLKASKFNGTSWSAVTGETTVHIFITIVAS